MFNEVTDLKNIQVEEETLFEFPYYYRFYYNALFCLLLSPNWISFKGNSVSIQQFLPQKVLCILMNITLFTFRLMSLRNNFATKIQSNPEKIFSLFSSLLWICYAIAMIHMNWFKVARMRKFMEIPRQHANFKSTGKGLALLSIPVILLIVPYVTMFWEDPDLSWRTFGTRTLYTFYVSNNVSQGSKEFDEIAEGYTPLIVLGIILEILEFNRVDLFEMFALLSSVAAYGIAASIARLYKENKGMNFQILLDRYALAKKSIRRINNVNGIVLLLTYVGAISHTSDTLVDVLDERKLSGILGYGQIYMFNLCILVIAAEVHSKMSQMKNKICKRAMMECDSKTMLNVEAFFRNCPGDCGLTGQNFFTVSYSLLGTSVSIFLTYVLVMIQLKGASTVTLTKG